MSAGYARRNLVRALALTPLIGSMAALGEAGSLRTNFTITGASITDAPTRLSYNDLVVVDPSTGRKIGVRVRLPAQEKLTGLILYSPGLGSGLSNGAAWCAAWQEAGYAVVNLSHPLTNESIWNTERTSFQDNLKRALSPEQYIDRVKDCSAVLTHCLNAPTLKAYIDPRRIGIAGHSYGALTVQAITGQLVGGQQLGDPRIRAAIAFSPGAVSVERAKLMSKVNIPFFSITGDHDQYVSFKDGQSTMRLGMALEKRLLVYEQLPAGHKQLFILAKADHMTFAGEPVDPQRYSRDVKLNHVETLSQWSRISEISKIFWQFYLSSSNPQNEADQKQFHKQLISHQNTGDILKFG
jgi:dienelactone hydrolase